MIQSRLGYKKTVFFAAFAAAFIIFAVLPVQAGQINVKGMFYGVDRMELDGLNAAQQIRTDIQRTEPAVKNYQLENVKPGAKSLISKGPVVEAAPYVQIKRSQAFVEFVDGNSGKTHVKAKDFTAPQSRFQKFDKVSQVKVIRHSKIAMKRLSIRTLEKGFRGGTARYYVQGSVFFDMNENGVRDPGEPGIPRVAVEIVHDSKGKIGQVLTNADGGYVTNAFSSEALTHHSFDVPDVPSENPDKYFNTFLADYFRYVPAPEGLDCCQFDLGYTLRTDALARDLRDAGAGTLVPSGGMTAKQWAGELSTWHHPYNVQVGDATFNAAEVLAKGNDKLLQQVIALDLNYRSHRGLSTVDPRADTLQHLLIEYGYYVVENRESVSPQAVSNLLYTLETINR